VVTGLHGSSKAGLELLLNPKLGESLDFQVRERLIKSHQRPKPRLDCLSHLSKIIKDQPQIAVLDSSDGLADAIVQICRASGVGAEIDSKKIKIDDGIRELVGEEKALEWGLYGGEDFELVLSLKENLALELVKFLGKNAAIIGKITKKNEVKLVDKGINLTLKKGFQHF
jgi:thiamine-monophosphate kinase